MRREDNSADSPVWADVGEYDGEETDGEEEGSYVELGLEETKGRFD